MYADESRWSHPGFQHNDLLIENVSAALPCGIAPDVSLRVSDGRIAEILPHPRMSDAMNRVDGRGMLLAPGFIDLHSDAIEKEIRPRPGGSFPIDIALTELDKRLASCGITSMYHCLCFGESETNELRTAEKAYEISRTLKGMESQLTVRNRVHIRFEMTDIESVPALCRILDQGLADVFSIMDHTPGQGQFKDMIHFRNYYSQAEHMTGDQALALAEMRQTIKESLGDEHLHELASICRNRKIPMASHDDDCPEKVEWGHNLGVSISEFPVSMAAAKRAVELGMHVLMGAPNILRGSSLTGNLSGHEAIRAGACTIIGSDYSPMSILHAVFKIARTGLLPLYKALKLTSSNPAKALGIDGETGSLREGRLADIILIDWKARVPRIARTFVAGREVFSAPPLETDNGLPFKERVENELLQPELADII